MSNFFGIENKIYQLKIRSDKKIKLQPLNDNSIVLLADFWDAELESFRSVDTKRGRRSTSGSAM